MNPELDELKLKQKLGQIILKLKQNNYFLDFKFQIPDNYPAEITKVELVSHNFPELFRKFFEAQANEIARKCVKPPLKKNPK